MLNPDFTFEFAVPQGGMPVVPTFAPAWTNLKSITARGADITDGRLSLNATFPTSHYAHGRTTGADCRDRELPAGEIPEEWVVLIFPSDRRYWKEPGASRRFVARQVITGPTHDYSSRATRGITCCT